MSAVASPVSRHVDELLEPLRSLDGSASLLEGWAAHLAGRLLGGGRLFVAGNGGSAAQAQHLTAELVGRYRRERIPLPAQALTVDPSTVTALLNDYGAEQVFARQVRGLARRDDVLLLLSTSGRSPNLLAAAGAAAEGGVVCWALTGPAPNPLAARADCSLCIDAPTPAAVQEVHLVAIHALCECLDRLLIGEAT
jgi:phosphoheptose isomerase